MKLMPGSSATPVAGSVGSVQPRQRSDGLEVRAVASELQWVTPTLGQESGGIGMWIVAHRVIAELQTTPSWGTLSAQCSDPAGCPFGQSLPLRSDQTSVGSEAFLR
jgi:hypothetical protein